MQINENKKLDEKSDEKLIKQAEEEWNQVDEDVKKEYKGGESTEGDK